MNPGHPVVVRAPAAMVAGKPPPDGPIFVLSDVGRRAIPAPPPPSADTIAEAIVEAVEMAAAVQVAEINEFLREAPLGALEESLAALREWPLHPGESWEDRAEVAAAIRRAIAVRTGINRPSRRTDG
jgi:hypothetical protein